MTERDRKISYGLKRITALLVSAVFAASLSGGAPVYGRPSSSDDNPPRTPWHLCVQLHIEKFCLSPFQTLFNGVKGGGPGPVTFSLRQQPFYAASVRLRTDNPEYSKKSPLWVVPLKFVSTDVFVGTVDRFVFNYPWVHIGPESWINNFKAGWKWDSERLGMNFFFHPYSGGALFKFARVSGYGYYESVPFVFLGSLMWEYFGETSLPANNDIVNSTVSGALFGEMFYRLTSNILDDRTTGVERFFRELGASILSPGRAFNRLLQGKLTRVTQMEAYQKEPLKITLAAGAHWFNKGMSFGTGNLNSILGIQIDYGDPFEIRSRKPFDLFKLRIDLSYGKNGRKKYLDNMIGYGLLFGKTFHAGNLEMLTGVFQHYQYWDNKIFEVSALGFGGGVIAKLRLSKHSNIQSAFHLGLVPLSASHSTFVDIMEDGSQGRNYDYSGGGVVKLESTLNLAKIGQVTAIYYLYRLHTYIGPAGYKFMEVFKPRIAVRLFGNLSLGYEYSHYHKDSHYRDFPDTHKSNREQKLYLALSY